MSRMIRIQLAAVATAMTLFTAMALGEPVWLSFNGSMDPAQPSVVIVSGSPTHVIYDITIPGMLVDDTIIGDSTYRRLSFPGEGALADEGLPELPCVSRLVGYAPGAQLIITAQCDGDVTIPDYLLYPAQPGYFWTYPPDPPAPFCIDSLAYTSSVPFPHAPEYCDTLGTWRDLGTGVVGVVPFSYTPLERQLVVHTHVVLTVTFIGGGAIPPLVARPRFSAYKSAVSNFAHLGIGVLNTCLPDRFIIVLGDNSQALRDAIEPLRIWKTLRGLDVFTPVVGVDFPPEPYQIRDYFASHLSGPWETAVLLVGDDGAIPVADDCPTKCPYDNHEPAQYGFPEKMGSDSWYGCIRGGDEIADIFVGRLASTDTDVVAGYVSKVLHYERDIDEQWMRLWLLFVLGRWPDAHDIKSGVRDEIPPHPERHIWQADGQDEHQSNATIVEYLEGDEMGIGTVDFFGHGTITGIDWSRNSGYWTADDAYGLNNRTWPPLVYSMACGNGFIRGREGPVEGLAEAWVENPNGGAVGVAANSGFGVSPPMKWQDRELTAGAFERTEGRDRLWAGENFDESKLVARYNDQGHRAHRMYAYRALHWMGDPTVNVWTQYLGDLHLEVTPEIIPSGMPVTIQAQVTNTQGLPVERAWVGLYKEGVREPELLCSVPTGPDGRALFTHVFVPSEGILHLSAFKAWYRPATADIVVLHHLDGDGSQEEARPGRTAKVGLQLTLRPVQSGHVTLSAEVARPTMLTLALYDASGRALASVRNVRLDCGSQTIDFSQLSGLSDLATGSYFLRYAAGDARGMLRFATVR